MSPIQSEPVSIPDTLMLAPPNKNQPQAFSKYQYSSAKPIFKRKNELKVKFSFAIKIFDSVLLKKKI